MEFKISAKTMAERVATLSKIAGSKATPDFDYINVRLSDDGKVRLVASDGETWVSTNFQSLSRTGSGEVNIHSKGLTETLRGIGDSVITFSSEDGKTKLSYGSGKVQLRCNTKAYVMPTKVGDGVEMKGNGNVLQGIRNCINYTSTDDVKPTMTGVYVSAVNGKVDVVATDGRRVVLSRVDVDGVKDGFSVVLPKKVSKLLSCMTCDSLTIHKGENKCKITISKYNVVCKHISGNFPDYNGAIPKNNTDALVMPKKELTAILKRVGIYCNQSSKLVRFDVNGNKATIGGNDADVDMGISESLEISNDGGFKGSFGLSNDYLIEMLSGICSEQVVLLVNKTDVGKRPILISPSEDDDEGIVVTRLMMPMKIDEPTIEEPNEKSAETEDADDADAEVEDETEDAEVEYETEDAEVEDEESTDE